MNKTLRHLSPSFFFFFCRFTTVRENIFALRIAFADKMLTVLLFVVLLLECSYAMAQRTEEIIAISGDSASGLVVGVFILAMVVFGVKMMLGIQITETPTETSEK